MWHEPMLLNKDDIMILTQIFHISDTAFVPSAVVRTKLKDLSMLNIKKIIIKTPSDHTSGFMRLLIVFCIHEVFTIIFT